jgi:3-deoxy-7-phosphoheptulonate synthase
VCAKLGAQGLPPRVMVDCSHGNSQRDYRRQGEVALELGRQIAAGSRQVFGVMLESHLVEGRQDCQAGRLLTYGQSITDACISIDETERVLERLAGAQQARG